MPDYLYNANPLDDIQYLLNKDTLYYSGFVLIATNLGRRDTLDEGFTWDGDIWGDHMTALDNYERPDIQPTQPVEPYVEYWPPTSGGGQAGSASIRTRSSTSSSSLLHPLLGQDRAAREMDAVFAMSTAC